MENTDVLEAPVATEEENAPQSREAQEVPAPEETRAEADPQLVPPEGAQDIQYRSFTPSIRQSSDGARTSVQIMTTDIARDGMIVEADGLDFTNFEKNPVLLWGHGWGSKHGNVPIGQCENIRRGKDGTWIVDTIFDEDEFSQLIQSKVKSGSVRAVSISWRTLDADYQTIDGKVVWVVTRSEILELSYVSVPADPNALVTQRSLEAQIPEDRLDELEDKISRLTSTLDTVMERLDAADPTVVFAKAEPAVEAIPVEPTVHVPARQATIEDYQRTIESMLPTMERLVENAIDKFSGRL